MNPNTSFASVPEDLRKALQRSDVLVGLDTLEYFYQLYDPATGGFYHSISSRDSEGPTPFAESTRFVLDGILAGGLTLPQWYKDKVSAWLLPHQDPDDGFFYETLWGKNTSGTRRDRDLSYSTDILERMCGVNPLYPTPQKRLKAESGSPSLPEYLAGEKEMIAFLDSLDWSAQYIWRTGSTLSAARYLITAAGLFETVHDYIVSRQNPETGLWGEGLGWMNTNGTMKLSGYFLTPGHPFPRVEKMVDSVLAIYSGEVPPTSATWIWNPFVALENAFASIGDSAPAMRRKLYESGAEIVNRAIDCALLMKRPDGGFASSIRRATPTLEGYTVGLGLPTESDMDGTIIAGQRLRTTMHTAFGIPCSQDYYRPYEAEFWERLKNKPPVVKTLPYLKTAKD